MTNQQNKKAMKYHEVKRLQRESGNEYLQALIDSGAAWTLEGSVGRAAMDALRSGACMLPKKVHYGAYGNRVPSRDEVAPGSIGSFQLSAKFYENLEFWADYYDEDAN